MPVLWAPVGPCTCLCYNIHQAVSNSAVSLLCPTRGPHEEDRPRHLGQQISGEGALASRSGLPAAVPEPGVAFVSIAGGIRCRDGPENELHRILKSPHVITPPLGARCGAGLSSALGG